MVCEKKGRENITLRGNWGRMLILAALIGVLLTLPACAQVTEDAPGGRGESEIQGRILLWHSWTAEDTEVLDRVIRQFGEANPGTKIVSVAVPAEELLEQYITSSTQGLGPDILVGSSEWVRLLAQNDSIRPLPTGFFGAGRFLPQAVGALVLDDRLYGLPLALSVEALYFNRSLVTQPPHTLDDLIGQLEGQAVFAMVPDFGAAYWGIQNFGTGLFDEDGTFTLDESGFREWLTWLSEAQNEAGMILNRDQAALRQAFMEGRIAYYVGTPEELPDLLEALGEGDLGVATLPDHTERTSGPLLRVEGVFLSPYSSEHQAELALAAALFLTNAEQNRTFMRLANRIPANLQVQVDPRVYPFTAGFAQQSRRSVTLPTTLMKNSFYELGDQAYANVLGGVLSPDEAVCRFGLDVIEDQTFQPDEVVLPAGCVAQQENPSVP